MKIEQKFQNVSRKKDFFNYNGQKEKILKKEIN